MNIDIDIELFRERLQSRCKELNISHVKLAKTTGISVNTIDKWFRRGDDKDYIPSLRAIYKVSKALNVSIDYLVNPDIECLTVSKQMISDYTGLSDAAIECLHKWNDIDTGGFLSSYANDIETLNTILEYYGNSRKRSPIKKHFGGFSLFHFIGNFFKAGKFRRIMPDLIRYQSGNAYKEIAPGDTVIKNGSSGHDVIDSICTPVNSETGRGNDDTTVDIVNSENDNEIYYIELSSIYREYCKNQIISTLKQIGNID